jgi:hypothetical protein
MAVIKTIQTQFAAQISLAIETATGHAPNVEVTMIDAENFSVLCDCIGFLREAMQFLSCIPGMTLDSVDICPDTGAIAYYKF